MLARIAQELFWLGRDLTRGEHTARMLDGAFHADVAGMPGERGIALSWDGVLAIIGAKPPAHGEESAAGALASATTPLATVMLLSELIPDRFEYRQGATYVDSTIRDLLEVGAGVCQDFVHLGLCVLRHHGIAARYVSGYLFAAPSDGGQESVEVDTHAWLEALLPTGPAHPGGEPVWVGADPTNRGLTGETHVKIGHGRHYADVPPIKGVYRGAANAQLDARVTMTRLTGADPASLARS